MKKLFGNAFKKQTMFEVVGGTNYLPKSAGNVYLMISEEKEHGEGVVSIKTLLFPWAA